MSRPDREDPPTEEQFLAISATSALGVAVSSGAGCGKTYVLTNRFLRLLEGPERITLDRLVALTFTEKAAAQLRGRIRKACRERLERGADGAGAWRKALRGLEAARIGTFHGFCGDLLRRHPIEANIPPGFEILEESIAPTFRDKALAHCLRRWLAEGNEDLIALAVEHGLDAIREALRGIVQGRAIGDPGEWVDQQPEDLLETWRDHWKKRGLPGVLEGVVRDAQPCLELLREHECTNETGRQRWAFLLKNVPLLSEAADPIDALVEIRENAKVVGAGNKDHWPMPAIYEEVKKALQVFRDRSIKKAQEVLDWDEAVSLAAAEQGLRFARLAAGVLEEYASTKRQAEMLDFDDLLRHARRLILEGDDSVQGVIGETIAALMVDEFQDTDPIQGDILKRLADREPRNGRLFLVGDTKQSIYRFRGAQPDIFETFRACFEADGRLDLSENFRSAPGILHFVNALFAEDLYRGDPEVALKSHSGLPSAEAPIVEFLWAEEPGPGREGAPSQDEKKDADDRRKDEARRIARLLAGRLKGNWPVGGIKPGKTLRPAGPGDVVLLFRSLNDAPPYEQALAEVGLDYLVVGGSAFFAQQEVLDVVNLLSAIEDPLDPLALAATLRGPFCGLSDDALYWLATARIEDRPGDLEQNLRRCESIAELDPTDCRRAVLAQNQLDAWRSRKDREPISALLDRVLVESGFEAALLGEWLGARKRANVRKLVRLARRYDRNGLALADFVARLRADLRETPREDQAATGKVGGQTVQLMTIHQAKGLEFPIVVLPDLDRKPPNSGGNLAIHPDLGPIVRPARDGAEGTSEGGSSLGDRLYRMLETDADREEALRLFYVATTRAENHLILSAGIVPGEGYSPTSPAMALLARRFNLQTGNCGSELPEGWPLPRVRVLCELPEIDPASKPPKGHSVNRQALSAIITGATEVRSDSMIRRPRPDLIDLDPARSLPPNLSRIDRLIRAILADPKGLDPASLFAVADPSARRLVPTVPRRTIAEALERLGPWVEGPQARSLARSKKVLRSRPWALAWPPGEPKATVFRGALDFAYLDRRGDWQAVALSLFETPEAAVRLRLLLSARAASKLGACPIRIGWIVRLGLEGMPIRVENFDDKAIEEALSVLSDPT